MKSREAVDYQWLSTYLSALSPANRLQLLRKLQVPHALQDIRIAPVRHDAQRTAERPISRKGVEAHLRKLQQLGFVEARAAKRDGRSVTEYVVNHARLFAVIEELRKLSLMRTGPGVMTQTTPAEGGEAEDAPPPHKGPALVLASGPLEGTAFRLEGAGAWVVGRQRGLAVSLPYDPFLSKQNTRIWREGSSFLAQDIPGSRNGTRVNWRVLAEGEAVVLVPSDALGVGRSLLIFRGA